MVKKIIKFLAYSVFFMSALMYFTPKVSLYYLFESLLSQHSIIVSSETPTDTGFSLRLESANISYKSIESANVSEINLKIFAFYNSIELKNILLSTAIKSFVPQHIKKATIVYTILNPYNAKATFEGNFGVAEAKFNLFTQAFHIELTPSSFMLKEYKMVLQKMDKTESGSYIYDKNI